MLTEELRAKLASESHCLSVSAPNNFGKSTLLRKLARSETETETDANPKAGLLMVYLDFNLRADDSPQAFYELILRGLVDGFKTRVNDWPGEKLQGWYERLISPAASAFNSAHAFLSALEETLQNFARPQQRLVLLLDEFDQPLQNLPGLVLLQLRALKDRYPDQLTFVVATNLPLLANGRAENEEGVAEFYELFEAATTLRLGGLGRAEADKLAQASLPAQTTLTASQLIQLYRLCGGHPVLTRLVAPKLALARLTEELEPNLRLNHEIRLECNRIWQSLAQSEHQALLQHLEGIQMLVSDTPLGSLVERGLVWRDENGSGPGYIFAQVFEWFIAEKLQNGGPFLTTPVSSLAPAASTFTHSPGLASPAPLQLFYEPYREIVRWYENNRERSLALTGNGAILFKYLYLRQSEPYCTKDELITAIWGTGGYSTENLDKLVSDLRQELGDASKQLIRTIPRRGLQMVGVRKWQG